MTSSQTSLPGFSAEQTHSLTIFIQNMVNTALHKHFGLPPPQQQAITVSKPPQPIQQQPLKLAQPPKQKQEHKPWQQAIAEKTAEKDTEKVVSSSNVTTATTSLRSTVLHQATKRVSREATFRLGNASPLASFLVSLLTSLPGYIHEAEDMEATGQG